MKMTPKVQDLAADMAGQQDLVALVPRINIQVFCDSPQTAEVVQLAAADRRMQRAYTSVHAGGIGAAVMAFQTQATPNLLIVESRSPRDVMLSELSSLAEVCQPDTKVVVIGHVNDVLLYRELMRQGISEYLVMPFQQMQFIELVAGLYQNPAAKPVGRVLAFIGAKGGVGSSSIAHNIGWSMARNYSTETVIADLDLAFGTAGLNFNQDIAPGITDVLTQPERVDTILIERMLTKAGEKLSLFGGPGGVERDFTIEPEIIEAILNALRSSVPNTLLDVPAIWAPWVKYALLHADQVIITATPDLASLRNARSIADLLKTSRPNDAPPKFILNQVGVPKRPEISVADFSKAMGVPISIAIPYDPQSFGVAQSNGQMIFEVAPKSKAAAGITTLVHLLGGPEKPPKKGATGSSLLERITSLRKK